MWNLLSGFSVGAGTLNSGPHAFTAPPQMTRLSSSKTRAFIGEEFDGFLQTSVRLLTALHAFLHGILRTL